MAMDPRTSGDQTSEFSTMDNVQKWLKIGGGLLVVVIPVIIGALPEGSAWIAVLGVVGSVAAALAGKVFLAGKYIAGRSAIKSEALRTEAAALEKKAA